MTSENVTGAESLEPSEAVSVKFLDDRLIDELMGQALTPQAVTGFVGEAEADQADPARSRHRLTIVRREDGCDRT